MYFVHYKCCRLLLTLVVSVVKTRLVEIWSWNNSFRYCKKYSRGQPCDIIHFSFIVQFCFPFQQYIWLRNICIKQTWDLKIGDLLVPRKLLTVYAERLLWVWEIFPQIRLFENENLRLNNVNPGWQSKQRCFHTPPPLFLAISSSSSRRTPRCFLQPVPPRVLLVACTCSQVVTEHGSTDKLRALPSLPALFTHKLRWILLFGTKTLNRHSGESSYIYSLSLNLMN